MKMAKAWLWLILCLALIGSHHNVLGEEAMSVNRFREIVAQAGDHVPLIAPLVSIPIWTNAIISNVMTSASGKVYRETLPESVHTIGGKYVVYTTWSKNFPQPFNSVLAYDANVDALRVYTLLKDGHGEDRLTAGTVDYDFANKTYTINLTYGDGFQKTTHGTYTLSESVSRSEITQNGVHLLSIDIVTRAVVPDK